MAEVSSEYWAYNDPRWANDPAYGNPETMKYVGPWERVLQATGFKGRMYEPIIEMQPSEYGGFVPQEVGRQYTPEAKAAIDGLRSAGYDLRWKHPDRRTFNTYYGLVTPGGEVQDIKIEGSDLGDMIMPLIKTWGAGLGLANIGAGINSLLGGAGAGVAPANALAMDLAGGSADLAGALGGGQFAAAGGLPLTAADLAALPADVLGQSGQIQNVVTPAAAASDAAAIEAMQFENTLLPSSQTNVAYPYGGELPYVNPTQATVGTVPGGSVGTPIISDYSVAANTLESMGIPATPENINALLGIDTAGVATTASSGGISALDQALLDMGAGATNVGAGAANAGAGLSAEALDAALAGGAPVGATTGTASLGGVGLPELTAAPAAAAPVAATAGAAGGGTEALSALDQAALDMGAGATNVGAATGGGSILDQVISFFRSPAGGAALSGLGSVIGGITQANAAQAASDQQAEAARNALQLQREMFEYQKNLLAPYQKYGTAALERLSGALGLEGAAKSQQMLEMDPGYGFRLGEGLKALERMQAARGSMLSGGAMKAGQRYAQDYASGEYSNAYNRLANIAGLGQTAGTQLGGAAQQFGQTAGNVMGQEADALAAGRIGRGSAYGNAIQGGLNAYSNYLNQQQQNQLFRDIQQQQNQLFRDIFRRPAIGG